MSNEIKVVYGLCDDHCKYAVFTKEDTIGLLNYVIANNALPPDLIIDGEINSAANLSAVNSIYDQNSGKPLKLWIGTQTQWDNWAGSKNNVFSIITDDPTLAKINAILEGHGKSIESLVSSINGIVEGTVIAKNATNAENAIKNSDGSYSGFTKNSDDVICDGNNFLVSMKPIYVNKAGLDFSTSKTEMTTIPVSYTLDKSKIYFIAGVFQAGLGFNGFVICDTASPYWRTSAMWTDKSTMVYLVMHNTDSGNIEVMFQREGTRNDIFNLFGIYELSIPVRNSVIN